MISTRLRFDLLRITPCRGRNLQRSFLETGKEQGKLRRPPQISCVEWEFTKDRSRGPFLGPGIEAVETIHGLLCMRGSAEDRPLVVLQNGKPVCNIGGVIVAYLGR